nr:MAG TPA: FANCD2 opposite strand protein [Crassvirales sp.]
MLFPTIISMAKRVTSSILLLYSTYLFLGEELALRKK